MTERETLIEDRITAAAGIIAAEWPDLLDLPTSRAPGRAPAKALIQDDDHADSDADIDAVTRRVSLRRYVTDVLNATCRMVMEERPITSPKALPLGDDVPGMCAFVERHAEWIAREWIDSESVADEMESLAGHIEVLTRPKRREWIILGPCPFVITDEEGQGSACRGKVRSAVGSDGDQAACSHHGDLRPVEWWEAVLGISLTGRIVGTEDLVRALHTRLHMTVTERTLRNWARTGQLTPHVPFGPIEDPAKPRRAWVFDLGVALQEVAMMYRECSMCSGPLIGRGSTCLRCLASMHQGPIFLPERPAYVVGTAPPPMPERLPQCSIDERARCDLTDLPARWCGCPDHRG